MSSTLTSCVHDFELAKFSQGRPTTTSDEVVWQHFSKPRLTCTVQIHSRETVAEQGHRILDANAKVELTVRWCIPDDTPPVVPSSQSQSQAYSQPTVQERVMLLVNVDSGFRRERTLNANEEFCTDTGKPGSSDVQSSPVLRIYVPCRPATQGSLPRQRRRHTVLPPLAAVRRT